MKCTVVVVKAMLLCAILTSGRLDAKLFVSGKEFAKEQDAREKAQSKVIFLEREIYELKEKLKEVTQQKAECQNKAAAQAMVQTQVEQPKCTMPCGKNGGCSKPLPAEPDDEASLLHIACAAVPVGIAVIASLLK